MPVQIQMRRGTTAQWSTANPTLASGEVGVDTSLTKFKVGNGSTAWNSLQYATLTYQGTYAGGTTYYPNDVVSYNNSSYICILQSTGNLPTNTTYWSLLALAGTNGTNGTSFTWLGAYNGATAYVANDVVSYNNSSYICILASTGNLPTNTTYWSLMALAGAGDVVGPASSVANEIALFDGASGKLIKSATTTGVLKATSGVIAAASAGTDYVAPSGALGTPSSGTLSSCTVDGTNSVGYRNAPQSTNTTLALTDAGKHVWFTGGSTATLTVPTNSSVAFPTGTTILVANNNSGNLTISGTGVTFQLANGTTGNRTVATKGLASLLKVDTDTWWVTGPGVT